MHLFWALLNFKDFFRNRFKIGSAWWTKIWFSWGVHQLLVDMECGPFLGPESGPQIGPMLDLGMVTLMARTCSLNNNGRFLNI